MIIVGCPPAFRGSDEPGRDMELQLLKHFPGTPLFVEKPVASGDVARAFAVADALNKSQTLCSVGLVEYFSWIISLECQQNSYRYMLRYLKAVQTMKKIIKDNNLKVMATIARYACAYESIRKPFWWDKEQRYLLIYCITIFLM
jgi:predicted dehydrogenase